MKNDLLRYLLIFASLTVALIVYFRIAEKFAILDKPNQRSSHNRPIIRGGGIVFILALWTWFALNGYKWPYFLLGATAIAVISFMDDLMTLQPVVRFTIHLFAVLLIDYQLDLFQWPPGLVVASIVVCIGALNAFNFMDGINGITGVYALVTFGTFWYVNTNIHPFTDRELILLMIGTVLIFLFFNFRKRARCFAGDVGSVTLAFVQIFLLLQLMHETSSLGWSLFFLVFGIDSVVTIVFRIRRKENIFKAHRTHLYQYMTNELGYNHLVVSIAYGLIQLLVNILVVNYFQAFTIHTVAIVIIYTGGYLLVRHAVLRAARERH